MFVPGAKRASAAGLTSDGAGNVPEGVGVGVGGGGVPAGHLHVVEDNFYLKENSMVYVGEARVAQLPPPRAQVMALIRRSARPPGMPDAFDRAPLR